MSVGGGRASLNEVKADGGAETLHPTGLDFTLINLLQLSTNLGTVESLSVGSWSTS